MSKVKIFTGAASLVGAVMLAGAAQAACPAGQTQQSNGNCTQNPTPDPAAPSTTVVQAAGGAATADAKADAKADAFAQGGQGGQGGAGGAGGTGIATIEKGAVQNDIKNDAKADANANIGDVTGVKGNVEGGRIESGAVNQNLTIKERRQVATTFAPGLASGECVKTFSGSLGTTLFGVSGGVGKPDEICNQNKANNKFGETMLVTGVNSGNMVLVATAVDRQMKLDPNLTPTGKNVTALTGLFGGASSYPGRELEVKEDGTVESPGPRGVAPAVVGTVCPAGTHRVETASGYTCVPG